MSTGVTSYRLQARILPTSRQQVMNQCCILMYNDINKHETSTYEVDRPRSRPHYLPLPPKIALEEGNGAKHQAARSHAQGMFVWTNYRLTLGELTSAMCGPWGFHLMGKNSETRREYHQIGELPMSMLDLAAVVWRGFVGLACSKRLRRYLTWGADPRC